VSEPHFIVIEENTLIIIIGSIRRKTIRRSRRWSMTPSRADSGLNAGTMVSASRTMTLTRRMKTGPDVFGQRNVKLKAIHWMLSVRLIH
jgi:hypothetical protein